MDCCRPIFSNYCWNTKNHNKFPDNFKKIIKGILMYIKKDNLLSLLPKNIWFNVFKNYNDYKRYNLDINKYYDNKLEYISMDYYANIYESFISYIDILKYHYTYCEAEQHILILKDCNCCKRHKINRPNKLVNNFNKSTITPSVNFDYDKYNCSCICRSHIRFLNRAFCKSF